ncbi:MAG: hypothetical protein COU72_02740 [Parcubacteria group bacterium CG10_big_fil_rev_8_21_14_0_10_41_35]|nr:MAG: hypothetical protein COU72_02740 [Parcubacteria group bacterium CG10_big_fil_rev_8_21_14_0_10_41_35]
MRDYYRLTLLGVSLLVGLVFSFYHLTIPRWLNESRYTPLALNQSSPSVAVDETIFYASRAREILDGHWWLNDVGIVEYKNTPSPFVGETVPAVILAGLSRLGGGVDSGFMLADFIFPGMVFILLSLLLRRLTDKPYLSLAGALAVMISYHYLASFPFLPSVLKQIIQVFNLGSYSHLIRSSHPQISLVIFLVWVSAYFKNKNYLWLGGLLGLLTYTHLFYWSFAFAWTVVGLSLALISREPQRAKTLGLSLVIGLALGLLYWLNLCWFYQLPQRPDFILNSWLATGWPFKSIALILLMLGLAKITVKNKILSQFWLSFFSTSLIIVTGSQILGLGFDDPIGHWLLRVIYPLTAVFGFNLLFNYLKRDNRYLALGLTLLLLGYQARLHWQYFKNQAPAFMIESERLELFDWLNKNTAKDSVVITAGLTDNLYLPVYTHNNVFIPQSQLTLAPTAEAESRFLIAQKIAGVSEAELKNMFKENAALKLIKRFDFDHCAGHYLYFRRFVGKDYYNCAIPKEKLTGLLDQYAKLEPGLTKYRADYWLGTTPIAFGKLLWENSKYKIYELP